MNCYETIPSRSRSNSELKERRRKTGLPKNILLTIATIIINFLVNKEFGGKSTHNRPLRLSLLLSVAAPAIDPFHRLNRSPVQDDRRSVGNFHFSIPSWLSTTLRSWKFNSSPGGGKNSRGPVLVQNSSIALFLSTNIILLTVLRIF